MQNQNKIEVVRDILFGQQIETYQNQIQQIQKQVQDNHHLLMQALEQTRQQLTQHLANIEKQAASKIQQVEQELQNSLKKHEETHVSKEQMAGILENLSKSLIAQLKVNLNK